MVACLPHSQRFPETDSLPVGVFADDALLLRLAERSRCVSPGCLRASEPMDANDLALEVARLADADRWDL